MALSYLPLKDPMVDSSGYTNSWRGFFQELFRLFGIQSCNKQTLRCTVNNIATGSCPVTGYLVSDRCFSWIRLEMSPSNDISYSSLPTITFDPGLYTLPTSNSNPLSTSDPTVHSANVNKMGIISFNLEVTSPLVISGSYINGFKL